MNTSRLLRAIQAVDTLLAAKQPAASAPPVIARVDEDGPEAETIEVQHATGPRWFAHGPAGTRELDPRRDARLPLAGRLGAEEVETLAYRPGRRWTLQCAATPDRVTKAFRRRRGAEAARRHELGSKLALQAGFVTAQRLAFRPRTESLEIERLPGKSLELGQDSADDLTAVGEYLRAFQALDAPPNLDYFGPQDELGVLDRAADRVGRLRGSLPTGWSAQRAALAVPTSDVAAGVSCHRDLHDGQLLTVKGGIALLDFDLLCVADAALDVGNLLAHLELRSLQAIRGAEPVTCGASAAAFLAGFDVERASDVRARLRFYRATTLLRLALVYAVRPGWWQLADPLVMRAARSTEAVEALAP